MRTMNRHTERRALEGQTLLLFALMSLMLMAGLGLIIDAGYDYSKRRIMQNAADTAALRGARQIAQVGTSLTPFIDQEVKDTAIANGVPSEYANAIECYYINNNRQVLEVAGLPLACQDYGLVPTEASGVTVRVKEEHPTLIMRAIGIGTSGTAAKSAALIRRITQMNVLDVPFAVCGVNARQTNNAQFDIMQTEMVPAVASPSASASPSPIERMRHSGDFNTSAYAYDWNNRYANGDFIPLSSSLPAPVRIYGDNIGDCGMTGWKGLIDHSDPNSLIFRDTSAFDYDSPAGLTVVAGNGNGVGGNGRNRLDPERTIDGVLGCRPNEAPTGCVLVLPIVYNFPPICGVDAFGNNVFCPGEFAEPNTMSSGEGLLLQVRWGAFLMYADGSGYSGRLIRNYPVQAGGMSTWARGDTEPITITLVHIDE